MTAKTYVEKHWFTGAGKTRCVADGKVIYSDGITAARAAAQISERTPMRPYFGACGHWHVSRTKPSHFATVSIQRGGTK